MDCPHRGGKGKGQRSLMPLSTFLSDVMGFIGLIVMVGILTRTAMELYEAWDFLHDIKIFKSEIDRKSTQDEVDAWVNQLKYEKTEKESLSERYNIFMKRNSI